MILYALIDPATGTIVQTGSGPDAVHLQLQEAVTGLLATEITDEAVSDASHYWTGQAFAPYPPRPGNWAVFDRAAGQWTDPRTPAEVEAAIAAARLSAVAAINAAAAEVRRRYVTDIPGQDALYLLKEAEARAWVASADPDPAQQPLISAETGITAPTGDEVAQIYLNLAGLYVAAAARLETARLGHIALAEAAPDTTSAAAAAQAFAALLQQGA